MLFRSLVSRSGVPSELGIAPDARELGVALRLVTVCGGSEMRALEASDPSLVEGFHDFEPDNRFRWTNGDAVLPDTLFDRDEGACVLTVHVACTARYPLLA